MRFLIFIPIIAFVSNQCYSQKADILQMVLQKNQANKVFSFDSSNKKNGFYRIDITYLGIVSTNNTPFKIITRKIVWGPNQHSSGTVYLYDFKNHYVGKFSLGSGLDLPNKVQKNEVIFSNRDKQDCDSKLITALDFSKEIPQKIFLRCKGDYGDVYSFSKE